ncbi:16166_t:CDS:1, partial [Racocetra persica]
EIFKLIQPEIKKIKDKKKEDMKISISITEDKLTFIGHNLDEQQKRI